MSQRHSRRVADLTIAQREHLELLARQRGLTRRQMERELAKAALELILMGSLPPAEAPAPDFLTRRLHEFGLELTDWQSESRQPMGRLGASIGDVFIGEDEDGLTKRVTRQGVRAAVLFATRHPRSGQAFFSLGNLGDPGPTDACPEIYLLCEPDERRLWVITAGEAQKIWQRLGEGERVRGFSLTNKGTTLRVALSRKANGLDLAFPRVRPGEADD